MPTPKSFPAPAFDEAFRSLWNDGSAEVSTYDTVCVRDGISRTGSATVVVRRRTYSEEDRIVNTDPNHPKGDLFPAMEMSWTERFPNDIDQAQEMTTEALALASVNGRPVGTAAKIDFSAQSWTGQLFHQLLFDATGIRSHQYSPFEGEGDEQSTLPYPTDGVDGDALWLWARHMAAPGLVQNGRHTVMLLPMLRSARELHRPLIWKRATLSRSGNGKDAETFSAHVEDGPTSTFSVQADAPYRVLRWDDGEGDSAVLKTSRREMPPSKPTAPR